MKLRLLSTKGKSKPKKAISWPTDRKYRKDSRLSRVWTIYGKDS